MLQIGVFITVRQNPSGESISFQCFRILPHSCMWISFTLRLQDEGNQVNIRFFKSLYAQSHLFLDSFNAVIYNHIYFTFATV